METFLDDVLDKLMSEPNLDLAKKLFVLPSKRAGGFLKNIIKQRVTKTVFAPTILSIEDFIKEITGLNILDNTNTIFQFYQTYQQLTPKENQENFETFYPWAQTLIYDFNEIDRYLIDTKTFFSHLSDLKEFDHWALGETQTELTKNYLKFWNKLPKYHEHFVAETLKSNQAYQGLIYRKASEQIENYLQNCNQEIIFIGFNALNNAEQKIIQSTLKQQKGRIFWDIDSHFLNDENHDTGHFIRTYQKEWDYFQESQHQFNWEKNHFETQKHIEIIGVPKNIGQAKYVAEILEKEELENTALVLNDEKLLSPILNSLPDKVSTLNITMGLSLDMTPLSAFFDTLFKIQTNQTEGVIYYKNILNFLNQPAITLILGEACQNIKSKIKAENQVYLTKDSLLNLVTLEDHQKIITLSFSKYNNPITFLSAIRKLIALLRPKESESYALENEYFYHFDVVFKKLQNLIEKHDILSSIKSLHRIYQDLLATETLDFQGSPFDGLQLMGMLETRVLDYKTIILTSVNEGVLPSGKTSSSFIPYALKKKYNLPTYKEKDAVYAYHFYRLLQRAERVFLLYNTEKSGLNAGEQSRFITQLEFDNQDQHTLIQKNVSPVINSEQSTLKKIEKTPDVLTRLKKIAEKGFSPSSLTNYIRNPLNFYKQYILQIKESEEVEETVATNTLGTVVHNVLEDLYKKHEGSILKEKDIQEMRPLIKEMTRKQFEEIYKSESIKTGKNLIIYKIALRYISKFLDQEEELVKKHKLRILAIENDPYKKEIKIPELDFPIHLRGRIDRIDELDEQIRVVDYKTGRVEPYDLNIKDWDEIIKDKKYSKAFQVLCYSLMIYDNPKYTDLKSGIISFKNLKKKFMPFTDQTNGEKSNIIDEHTLEFFEAELKNLIKEIFDPSKDFEEKEV